MAEIMMDGELLKVGDGVYSLSFGEGKVYEIRTSSSKTYPIRVLFSVTNHSFSLDFANLSINKKTRDLYWQKPEIIPPPKPKKKVKVWDWFVEYKDGSVCKMTGQLADFPNFFGINLAQKIDGTEREVER